MKKRITLALCMLSALLAITFAFCSEENETKRDWRSDLYEQIFVKYVGEEPLAGIGFDYIFGVISIKDSDGKDLLRPNQEGNVRESDFYFEVEGKRYAVGDTIDAWPTLKSTEKIVGIHQHMSGAFYYLHPFALSTAPGGDYKAERLLADSPYDIEYYFVWPSKNIRKHIRVYAEFNQNFFEDLELAEPDEKYFKRVPFYKWATWVDGKCYNNYGCYFITI